MRLVGALLCVLAVACCIQGKETGELALCGVRAQALGFQAFVVNLVSASGQLIVRTCAGTSKRLLAQDSTPQALNVTLVGITIIKSEQADLIRDALLATLPEPKPTQAAVSSNTAIQDNTLTLIILVYPPAGVNSSSLQTSLQALDTTDFASQLKAAQLAITNVIVNGVTPQPQNQYQRDPLTGGTLAGQPISFSLCNFCCRANILHLHLLRWLCGGLGAVCFFIKKKVRT